MRRKVVQQGTSTLMISLPAKWTKQNGVKKGSEVDILENKDRLVILPATEATTSRTEIDITGMSRPLIETISKAHGGETGKDYTDPTNYRIVEQTMLRLLAALYKAGYDEVKINYDHPGTIDLVQSALRQELSEYEIVEQTKHYCVLQDISGVLKERFDPAVNRIFFLLMQMAEESEAIIKNQKYDELKALRFLEESNNRFTTFCRRLLSKKGYRDPSKIQFIYLIIETLEQVADQYKYLFDYLMEEHPNVDGKTLTEYKRLNKMLRDYFGLYSSGRLADVVTISTRRKRLIENCMHLFKTSSNADCMVLHYILVICQMVFESVEPAISLTSGRE